MAANAFKTRNAAHHLTAALVLLAVFALPFHFHVLSPAAQLAQECSCYQGARTYAVALTAATDWTPLLQASVVHQEQPQVTTRLAFDFHAIRAPPSL